MHACGYPTKGKLAAGTLDRNAPMHTATRRCLSVCASISQKTRRVCLICRVTATDSFWVYCTLSFSLVAKLRTMTVSGTPANWLDEELRRRCLPFPPLFSLLSVLHFCSPMRFLLPPFPLFSCSWHLLAPACAPLRPLVPRPLKHKYHSLST